ncbi:MAG: NAD(P)-binding domain-containing protein, partial [Alicyclobacillus herbarius]|uniref:NAD(P)-binding domain-containing protein n=1 Tax=Alicyclobacillus herbarius TaxID=122960 RepID=UPI00235400B2
MRVGFIGFGEAASAIASGLHGAGLTGMMAFDVVDNATLRERASAAEVTLTQSLNDLAESSDIVLSMVTAAS